MQPRGVRPLNARHSTTPKARFGWVPAGAAALASVAAIASLPTIIHAQEAQAIDIAPVTALLADLTAGNRSAAIGRISSVESMTGEARLITNGTQFVDLVGSCPGTITRQRPFGDAAMVDVEWQCEGGRYVAQLYVETGKPYVAVSDFLDEAGVARRATRRTMLTIPPPAPPAVRRPLTPLQSAALEASRALEAQQQQAMLEALAAAVQAGSPDAIAGQITPQTRFTFGWRDPFNSTNVNELDGEGIDAAREQFAHAVQLLGQPTGFSCEPGTLNVCRWAFAEQGRGLLSFVFLRGGTIQAVQLIYVTPETVERATRFATPEQIEALRVSMQGGGQ